MKPTQDLGFWRKRLKEAGTQKEDAIWIGFNKEVVNIAHKALIDKYVPADSKVLDVACGIGRTAHWFIDKGYLGIDFMPEFLEIAKRSYPNKKFLLCDITKPLPLEDGQFDWAVLISVRGVVEQVIGLEEWLKIEKELKRVAKKVLVLEYGNGKLEEIIKSFYVL